MVEGWIGREGIRAAAAEFVQHGYTYVVASGGLTASERWEEGGWNYAVGAAHELMRSGVPESRIIVATARDVERERTFESTIVGSLRGNKRQAIADPSLSDGKAVQIWRAGQGDRVVGR